jgi:hypothetical protein
VEGADFGCCQGARLVGHLTGDTPEPAKEITVKVDGKNVQTPN